MRKLDANMTDAMDGYLSVIATDYVDWGGVKKEGYEEIREKMNKEFVESLTYEVGNKYIKVIKDGGGGRSVHSFIVNTHNDKKFAYGDILMAAGWKAPARNFKRGNVFTDTSRVRWTGAM